MSAGAIGSHVGATGRLSWRIPLRQTAVVLAIVSGASVLTFACGSSIRYERFAFFNGAVVASAIYAGAPGGLFATLAGSLVVDVRWAPLRASLTRDDPSTIFGVMAFVLVSLVVTGLAVQFRAQSTQLRVARDIAAANEERRHLLAEAGRVLSSSLDYESTVSAVARLAVPHFADWCAVDLLVGDEIKRLAVAHCDPEKARWVQNVVVKLQPSAEADAGVGAVIRTGEPHFAPVVTDDMLVKVAEDDEHLALLRAIGIHSAMIVPITTRGMILGALTLANSRPERRFGEADLATAQALGRRAAVAIDNARLYRSARAADEVKTNFLATMTHELRTPLTAIIGFDQLLAEGIVGPVSDGQKGPLERIKRSAMQLLSLIEEMFLFARLDAGDELIHPELVSPSRLIDDVVDFMSPSATASGLALRADPIDPSLELRTDPGRLRQILVGLVSNAVKFTRRGEIVVRVVERDDEVVFEIADTGIGIEQANLERIFDPFWQVENTRTRKIGGSGLGLTVARRLAELLGGSISVESTPSVGSTFRVALPKSRSRSAARQRTHPGHVHA